MTFRLALRSLAAQPVRSIVLACGFGLGIGAMAGLLGIGEVVLEQSRAPALDGGGDVVVRGQAGALTSARFLLSSLLETPPLAGRARAASPALATTLYLVENGQPPLALRARGGIPSLERAIGDPETAELDIWRDAPRDRAWAAPDPADVLRAMDRFHDIPDVPARAESWAEWLYFNGRTETGTRFYLTFLVGPRAEGNRREAGVRLQLERDGELVSFSDSMLVDESNLLETAPDLTLGRSTVRLVGVEYRIRLGLVAEGRRPARSAEPAELTGELVLEATPGRSLPPIQVLGARGWVSGYVVPVMSGELRGELRVGGETISLDGGTGYHDHNWGFWGGVTWQWGQVAHEELSLVYGRIRPPADALDPSRMPGFLVALGPEGPLGYTTSVAIDESGGDGAGAPSAILVESRSRPISLRMELDVKESVRTAFDRGPLGGESGLVLFQMRADYRVEGTVAGRSLSFEAPGSAETFRGASAQP